MKDPHNMEDFKFRPGDFVAFGKTIGHVSEVNSNNWILYLDAYFTDEAHTQLMVSSYPLLAGNTDVRIATEAEADEIGFEMLARGYVLNGWRRMKRIKAWQVGDWVRVTRDGRKVSGIIVSLDIPSVTVGSASADGRLTYYAFSLSDSQMTRLTSAGRKAVVKELSSTGYRWDVREKRFEKVFARVPVGSMYWYLTETLIVRSARDSRSPKHNSRFACGNYFLTAGDAAGAVMALQGYIQGLREKGIADAPSIGSTAL